MSRRIAIIGGTGPEGMGLANRWLRAGESVILGSRSAERAQAAAEKLRRQIPDAQVAGAENLDAARQADIVVLTIPFEGHAATLTALKPALSPGKIVIDCTVPLASSVGGKATRVLGVWQGSAAQQAAELVPAGVPVAAAFQNIGAKLLEGDAPVDCDVIICADDPTAFAAAAELARRIPGVRAVNAGKLENARIVEQLTALLIAINMKHKSHAAGLRVTGLKIED
jgi:NADPH-dependent F420 reductase